jgi:hypothetical protein
VIRRWALNIAAAVSLLLLILTVAFWTAGLTSFRYFEPYHANDGWTLTISSDGGEFAVLFASSGPDYARPPNFNPNRHEVYDRLLCWKPATAFAAIPCLWTLVAAGRFLRARRIQTFNLCGACGYNLTANTSGVCPECGTAVVLNSEVARDSWPR